KVLPARPRVPSRLSGNGGGRAEGSFSDRSSSRSPVASSGVVGVQWSSRTLLAGVPPPGALVSCGRSASSSWRLRVRAGAPKDQNDPGSVRRGAPSCAGEDGRDSVTGVAGGDGGSSVADGSGRTGSRIRSATEKESRPEELL